MTEKMKSILRWEEVGQFVLSIILFQQLDFAWWTYPAFFFAPDVSMLGYAVNTRIGAFTYNVFHHKFIALMIWGVGNLLHVELLQLAGLILFGHAAFDRILGYGLKYNDSFQSTHLGWIGKK